MRPVEQDENLEALYDKQEEQSRQESYKLMEAEELKKLHESKDPKKLAICFVFLVIVGLFNRIFSILVFYPMKNYPLFVNLLTTFAYIPLSWLYIMPARAYTDNITKEADEVPKYKFAIMGFLDSIAGILQNLSMNSLKENGGLVILLLQSSIPVSMVISKVMLKTKYHIAQYGGAALVFGGIIVALLPEFKVDCIKPTDGPKFVDGYHPGNFGYHPNGFSGIYDFFGAGTTTPMPTCGSGGSVVLWSSVIVLSCIPMALSSVFKELALGTVDLDPIFLNGWIAVFQFLMSLILLYPSAPLDSVGDPPAPLKMKDVGLNMWDGMKCFVGINTVASDNAPWVDDECGKSAAAVLIYVAFNVCYNILILLVIKFGSANVLWVALTVMVPFGNLAFSLKFMPNHQPVHVTDVVGLVLIMVGIIFFRFHGVMFGKKKKAKKSRANIQEGDSDSEDSFEGSGNVTVRTPFAAFANRKHQQHQHEDYQSLADGEDYII